MRHETIRIMLGDGYGAFGPPHDYDLTWLTSDAQDLAVADIDGDTRPDVAVGCRYGLVVLTAATRPSFYVAGGRTAVDHTSVLVSGDLPSAEQMRFRVNGGEWSAWES